MKVVINRSYGSFSLSESALQAYAERKGFKLYTLPTEYGYNRHYKISRGDWDKHEPTEWRTMTHGERKAAGAVCFDCFNIPRDDSDLVAVVEGVMEYSSELAIVEIPDDVEWVIENHDGKECVAEFHRTWGK